MQIKVLSLNLWNGGRLLNQAKEFLYEQQADLMFLQEAYNGKNPLIGDRFRTVQILSSVFPNHDFYFAPVFLDKRQEEGNLEHGQLIISKFPLTQQKSIHFDMPYDEYDHDSITDFSNFPTLLQTAFVQINNIKIKLLNIHGPVNNDGTADSPPRIKMRNVILKEIENQPHVILAGDFNVQPQTKTIASIEEKLTSIFKDELITSFNLQQKNLEKYPGFATAVVDMMFIRPNFKIINKLCPQANISDHLPLIATLDV